MKTRSELISILSRPTRAGLRRAAALYALDLLSDLSDEELVQNWTKSELEKRLLNGAKNWDQYSYGGCSLISNYDILERFENAPKLAKHPDELLHVQAQTLERGFDRLWYALSK